jgi:hypothetical protein
VSVKANPGLNYTSAILYSMQSKSCYILLPSGMYIQVCQQGKTIASLKKTLIERQKPNVHVVFVLVVTLVG